MKVIVLLFIVLGLILGIRYVLYFPNLKVYKVGDAFQEQVTLLSEPRFSGFYQTFKIGSISVSASQYPEYHYGDLLQVSGQVSNNSFQATDGTTINQLIVKNPKIEQLENYNVLIWTAAYFRSRIINTFNSYLPQNESALLFGIVFGGSQGFSKDMYGAFQRAGVLHVIAASGMNVTIFAGFLFTVLALVLKRRQAILFSILGIFYYALISGFTASVLRASIMASIVFSAELMGKRSTAILSLFLTSFFMLFLFPKTIFDVGFQLSFFSTLGILLIKPIMDSFALFNKVPFITDDIKTSIAAQLGSIPVMIAAFGSYSIISIPVNALVLWTIPFLMILGGIAALCSIAVPFVSVPFLYLSYSLLLYFEKVVTFANNVPLVQLSSLPLSLLLGYYIILSGILLVLSRRRTKKD